MNEGHDGGERWRAFVAVDLPGHVKEALSALQARMPPMEARCVRWVRAGGIHLTLCFLGDVDAGLVPAISEQVSAATAQSGPFTLALADVGAFPSLGRPRVFWVGLSGETERLRLLQSRVEGALTRVGYRPERRPFDPHLTVGRVRREARPDEARRAGQAFGGLSVPDPAPTFRADSVVLFRSHLGPGGAEYERLFQARLG